MTQEEFSALIDRSGLSLSSQQKSQLFAAYPLFQAMVARATPPLPREAEPALTFAPEVE